MPHPKKHHRLVGFLPLLLVMFYAAVSILKLSNDPPSLSPSTLLSHDNSVIVEVEPLRTHISSSEPLLQAHEEKKPASSLPCSALIDGGIGTGRQSSDEGFLCCDRSQYRTDVCYMKGDIRTDADSSSIALYNAGGQPETVRPYTRKWETAVMDTVQAVTLRPVAKFNNSRICEVRHRGVPAIVFSTGGYTGNVYHEFNDGLIPLYVTAQRFERKVVLVVIEYRTWWFNKYRSVLKRLTKYRVVDFSGDRRVHCFDEMIVGLKIHGDLSIDPHLMPQGKGIQNFQSLMVDGFSAAQPSPAPMLNNVTISDPKKPKIAILVRHGSRVLYNLKEIVRTCHKIGFHVELVDPKRFTPLADIFAVLNSSDVMLAVHGAALTHFLFMRPSSILIQVVPLGLDWPAETYYGEPARKLGLKYMAYKVAPEESSLTKVYGRDDPVIADPRSITEKGWWETKKIYLDKQNVRINMRRFRKLLEKAHSQVYMRYLTM